MLGFGSTRDFSSKAERKPGMKKLLMKAIAVLGLCLCLEGCIPAAALTVYGVSRHRTHKAYRQYEAKMEKTNQERQNQGLEPLPIASFQEWKKSGKPEGEPAELEAPAPSPGK
jgi:hypothetical protein